LSLPASAQAEWPAVVQASSWLRLDGALSWAQSGAMRELGHIRSYEDLVAVLRARCDEFDISFRTVDDRRIGVLMNLSEKEDSAQGLVAALTPCSPAPTR
jgi:hypothetical protein